MAFSYDTLVESKEPVEEGDVEERDGERSDHPAANPVSRGDREGSTPSPDNADSTDRRRLEGYYGSAIDILGLKGEIDVVRREFDKQRAIDRQIESRNGKAGKRRVHQG